MRLILGHVALEPDRGLANLARLQAELAPIVGGDGAENVVVLPELVGGTCATERYEEAVGAVARALRCTIAGGSHHTDVSPDASHPRKNRGAAVGPRGEVLARYEKRRPYGVEHEERVSPGSAVGCFARAGRAVAVLVCADFWFSELLHAIDPPPDLILVPSFSISQKPDGAAARELWGHMAVSRAYEFGAYVGISDWAATVRYGGLRSSGVAGLASPNPAPGEPYFSPVGASGFRAFELDFDRLDALRDDRRRRGFL